MIKYKFIHIYSILSGVFLAIFASMLTQCHINFSQDIDILYIIKLVISFSIAYLLQKLYLDISTIKEKTDREFGKYIDSCDSVNSLEDMKLIDIFNDMIKRRNSKIHWYPYIVIFLILLFLFVEPTCVILF